MVLRIHPDSVSELRVIGQDDTGPNKTTARKLRTTSATTRTALAILASVAARPIFPRYPANSGMGAGYSTVGVVEMGTNS